MPSPNPQGVAVLKRATIIYKNRGRIELQDSSFAVAAVNAPQKLRNQRIGDIQCKIPAPSGSETTNENHLVSFNRVNHPVFVNIVKIGFGTAIDIILMTCTFDHVL